MSYMGPLNQSLKRGHKNKKECLFFGFGWPCPDLLGVMFQGHTFFKDLKINGSRIVLKLESIALWLNSDETQIGKHGTRIALELEGHALGLNLNVTKVSSSLGSLCHISSIFWCKRVNGPTKQPKEFWTLPGTLRG